MSGAHHPAVTRPAQIWVYQKAAQKPAWVESAMVGDPAPNGTFMLQSELGQVRVHPGNVIFEYKGHLYACPHSEIQRTIQELDDRFAPPPPKDTALPSLAADVAPRDDDTDDITRRIRAQQGVDSQFAFSAKNSTLKPQKTAVSGVDSGAKELTVGKQPSAPASSTQKPQKSAASRPSASKFGNAPRKWPATKGNPPSIEMRPPSELSLDDSYQRATDSSTSQTLIRKIAHNWDWRMCLPLVVSKRDDGTLWVIDGQHRLAAATLRGDIQYLPCCVAVYGSVADEAAMFVAMNRTRKAMNRLDDFHAATASGDSEALEIAKLITDAGFTVSRRTGSQSWVPGEVAFTSAIAKVLRKHGAKVCADALKTMQEAFPDEVLNAGASMFTALTKLAITPPEGFDPDRLFRALLRRNQKEWASFLNETKGGGEERAFALRQVLLMAYEEEGETAE
ncbi:DUF6551 family protein [Sphingobium sp. CFD-1]|uniref:DUF6551 family protein n=1 Tax=Sphingobium sp. CFD-1 TaxID=2878545 RepID=UPI00214C6DEE|nr:DUF6551 family protein [Sphingobium sp. CFD-1]